MREIEFRAKHTWNGSFVYGYLVYVPADNSYRITQGRERSYFVDPETVGQYTGLKDKNGIRIFEGDIVKIPDDYKTYGLNAGEIYEVYFAYGGFRMKPKYKKTARGYWLEDDGEYEVIGNIYDNPELLN